MADINEILDTLSKIKRLLGGKDNREEKTSMLTPVEEEQRIRALKIVVQEQKRDYDYLLHIYNRTRATEGLLLTATFGIIAYLFSKTPTGPHVSLSKVLFIPPQAYGKVIYIMAAVAFLYGSVRLTLIVFGNNPWETAYDISYKCDFEYNELSTLEHFKKRYDDCHEFNLDKYARRKSELKFLFYCVLITAIILIVIKVLK
jgi:hypothetical protein